MPPPLRAGNIFYFPFSANDQLLINPMGMEVIDEPFKQDPVPGDIYAQSLRIRFLLVDPFGPLPQVRPLCPGLLRFLPDRGTPPAPEPNVVDPANYPSWPTVGTLLLTISDPRVSTRLKSISALPLVPTHIWYSRVHITEDFLFQSIPALGGTVMTGRNSAEIAVNTPRGRQFAISGFLNGRYAAPIVAGANTAADSLATIAAWPEIIANQTPSELIITAANDGNPFDGTFTNLRRPGTTRLGQADFYENPHAATDDDPVHPRYGAIPARLVYRSLRFHASGNMTDAGPGTPIADTVLVDDPTYVPIRFTRIWNQQEDRSVHFPSQIVDVQQHAPGTIYFSQRLPCHGLLWIGVPAAAPVAPMFGFAITGLSSEPDREMRWLDGETAEPWRQGGGISVVDKHIFDVRPAGMFPHIILRRRMAREVIYHRGAIPDGLDCTYSSLRRACRAFVNNRIAGGRLNFEKDGSGANEPSTVKIIRDAIDNQVNNFKNGMPPIWPDPLTRTDHFRLRTLLTTLFPDQLPAQMIDGTRVPDPGYARGHATYFVWYTIPEPFRDNATKRAFEDRWLGGGGAGALLTLGLAPDYVVNPSRNPNETAEHYVDRITGVMLSGILRPGDVLQYWSSADYLEIYRRREVPNFPTGGHSMIFFQYKGPQGNPTGFHVLDQHRRLADVDLVGGDPPPTGPAWGRGARQLMWELFTEVWLAARWTAE